MIMTETPRKSSAAKVTTRAATQSDDISLTERLEHAAQHVAKDNVTVGELFHELGKGSPYLLMALIAITQAIPLPTWGLSIPFGLAIILLAIGGMRNEKSQKLPESISSKKVSPKVAPVLRASAQVSRFLEKLMKPRWQWALWHPAIALSAIAFSGFLLMLPIPIPFTNMASGLSATLLSLAMLYKDGVAMIFATIIFAVTVIFYGFLGWGALKLLQSVGI